MTAPIPLQGTSNPYTGTYQIQQYDIEVASRSPQGYSGISVLNDLATPPAAATNASPSPSMLYKENPGTAQGYPNNPTGNPVDQHSSSFMTSTVPLVNPYYRPAGS